jgi:hypothetical protein
MASLRLLDATQLDATRAGRPGEDLERKLHGTIVGQDEAIHHIVRALPMLSDRPCSGGPPDRKPALPRTDRHR